MNPPPTRASCRQLSPKVARPLGLPRLRTRDLASPSHLGQRAAGAGAEKQADHRQPPDLPTPESAAQPDSPRWLRAPKIQRSQTSTGCAAGRGGSRGAPGRAHPQLTALTTRTLPRIKHAVEPNLAAGLGSGGQRLDDGMAKQAPGQEDPGPARSMRTLPRWRIDRRSQPIAGCVGLRPLFR